MKLITNISFIAMMVVASACNQSAKQQSAGITNAIQAVDNTAGIFKAYIKLKDEFIKSDVEGIKAAAEVLDTKLSAINGCTGTAAFARQIAIAIDIKEQRATFLILSDDIIKLMKKTPVKVATIYVDHCPMANNGKGGDWLSLNKTIENPYFPEHMKECGQVKEIIN